MKDQHTKIKGYRDLSQSEIDLMNEIKEHGEVTNDLLTKLNKFREESQSELCPLSGEQYLESLRCLRLAQESLQTGQMWFVRAVALPESF